MIERVHQHIITELQQNARTDTIFILTAIFLNLVTLAVNSIVATTSDESVTTTIVMFLFVALLVVVNIVAEITMLKGKDTKTKLLNGLLKLYKEKEVDVYYDNSVLSDYDTKYNLFILAAFFIGLVAIVVPLVLLLQ